MDRLFHRLLQSPARDGQSRKVPPGREDSLEEGGGAVWDAVTCRLVVVSGKTCMLYSPRKKVGKNACTAFYITWNDRLKETMVGHISSTGNL